MAQDTGSGFIPPTGRFNPSTKVAIVGAGVVGSTAAYAMMLDGVVSEIALIDVNKEKAEGEALDLRHGMQFTKSTKIWSGDSFELVAGAQVVVITAGFAQKRASPLSCLQSKRGIPKPQHCYKNKY